ncbi:zinc finger CCCH domain-containing protein 10-like [Mizuhopecten yessoensis]|uniref:Zinc finger CCCH domain-containing protein 10 n=1 Tax=Mizuhopecten yessoensis TaxID=6573 RepID=A0A210PFY5_MIZYE|nr:zinc finger CCCH domain-containing protein 10-like [Mizuhopecten yessoensis]XP_021342638.1 zinc finger CCCH domain-containing protein 10-like [Mizuhopecten yessoensis]XP_021342640.1 zinc finger CCCH domain-containing protein 10-like [Mizuhopecten yessoensis]XP_021342641.1 zinc finger CCCH domain-containing protein 10-like [Mizuhopecten yessoensis]XP_021342642.1 zinc finger CCCH domain-containing protein 10-like [Mizuhopecten yessoensis]XP_021342643.1 zinc finger CCCH domain-containing prote
MHNLDCKMSDNSESGSESSVKFCKQNGNDDDICRDYLRNVCKRGKRCKYRHPHSEESSRERKYDYTFCHDFQNTGCHRPNCKFLHCSREEEEHYKQTGQLPVRLQQAAALGVGVTPTNDMPLLKGEIPICKDYLKMNCKRGIKCKFRHLTATEYEFELRKSDQRNNNNSQNYDPYEEDFDRFESFEYCHSSSGVKRRRTDRDLDGFNSNYVENRYSPTRPLSYQLIEDENSVLRRKVDELKKQVADLTATNEVLLEQNARYRVSRTSLGTSHVAAPQSLNHLANSLAQQIALNSELASQHALQQRLARELAPVSAAAQGSLNQPTVTMNPGSIPVSLPQNNLTGVTLAPVSIQQPLPPPVSMTQALPPPVSLTQSLPQNMQANSTTLVSYPIVSQNLRTVSSLAH